MKIHIASLNPQKVKAVKELASQYLVIAGATIVEISVPSGVSNQPKSLEETVRGAIHRAKSAIGDADYSFGIESGMFDVPYTKTGQMDVCVCAIFDGKDIHLGLSSAFEVPLSVTKCMEEGMSLSEATAAAGLTDDNNVGAAEGLIGILTHGRLDRLGFTMQAVTTALIHLENAHLFNE